MDEWVDLNEKELVDLEEEIHSHLNHTLSRGEGPKVAEVPPMPGPSPVTRTAQTRANVKKTEPSVASTSTAKLDQHQPKKASREDLLSPPPRRLTSRLREMGHKLRAKL